MDSRMMREPKQCDLLLAHIWWVIVFGKCVMADYVHFRCYCSLAFRIFLSSTWSSMQFSCVDVDQGKGHLRSIKRAKKLYGPRPRLYGARPLTAGPPKALHVGRGSRSPSYWSTELMFPFSTSATSENESEGPTTRKSAILNIIIFIFSIYKTSTAGLEHF